MIYILGTDHYTQHGDDIKVGNEKVAELYNVLKETVRKYRPTILAEETSL